MISERTYGSMDRKELGRPAERQLHPENYGPQVLVITNIPLCVSLMVRGQEYD